MAIFTKKKRDQNGASASSSGNSPPLAQSSQFSRSQSGSQLTGQSPAPLGSPPGAAGILQQPARYQDGSVGSSQGGSILAAASPPNANSSILSHSNSQSFSSPPNPALPVNPAQSPPATAPTPAGGHTVLYPWAQRRLHYLPSALLPPVDPTNPTLPISPVRGPLSAPPFPRYGHSVNPTASLPNGDLYIFGGLVANAVKNDLYVLGCAPGGSPTGTGATGPQGALSVGLVETRGEVPGPRVGHASVGVGNVLIVWGGDTKSRPEDRQDDSLYLLNLSAFPFSWGQHGGGEGLTLVPTTRYEGVDSRQDARPDARGQVRPRRRDGWQQVLRLRRPEGRWRLHERPCLVRPPEA